MKNFNVLTMIMTPTMPSCSNTEPDVSNHVDDDDVGGDDDADHANKLRR